MTRAPKRSSAGSSKSPAPDAWETARSSCCRPAKLDDSSAVGRIILSPGILIRPCDHTFRSATAMSDKAESILSDALGLPESDRFLVLEGLLESLRPPGLWDMNDA